MKYKMQNGKVITFGKGRMPEPMRKLFEQTLYCFKNGTDQTYICYTLPNDIYKDVCKKYISWALGEPDNSCVTMTCFLKRELNCKEHELKHAEVRAHRIAWLERLAKGIW